MSDPWNLAGESVSLGQPGTTINLVEGSSFCISGRSGDMLPGSPQGLFFRDTRFLSRFELRVNGEHPYEAVDNQLQFRYQKGATKRGTRVSFSEAATIAGNLVTFEVIVPDRGEWSTCIQITPAIDDEEIEPRYKCGQPAERATPV